MEEQPTADKEMGKSGSHLLVYLAIAVLILISGFIFFTKIEHPNTDQLPEETEEIIPVIHQYLDGAHTYIGSIYLPTPCHSISAEAIVLESYPEQVTIKLETKQEGDLCAQVITEKKFKVSFQASLDAEVSASLNGSKASLYVSEAPGDINLEATPLP